MSGSASTRGATGRLSRGDLVTDAGCRSWSKSAGLVLVPNAPLGLITTAVQALAGILLPSATVFLLLLCNDPAVLGPCSRSAPAGSSIRASGVRHASSSLPT